MTASEFDVIERFFAGRVTGSGPGIVLGPGDDCAILDVPDDAELCVSTDTLGEGVHFPVGASGGEAAARSIGANLSDLAAMGATPLGFTLSLTLPTIDENWLDDFSARLAMLASSFSVPLVGGNISRGPMAITLTVFGTVEAGRALRRSGAAPGDDIYISGWPGEAAAGLRSISMATPDPVLVDRYETPQPRLALGVSLIGHASAAIDVSDGLIADLTHLVRASGCGARIDATRIPVSAALERFDADPARLAMAGGDDYELCFTAPASEREFVAELAGRLELPLTRIGVAVECAGVVVLDAAEREIETGPGYDHFRRDG